MRFRGTMTTPRHVCPCRGVVIVPRCQAGVPWRRAPDGARRGRTGGGPPYERYGLGAWEGPGDRWRLDGHLGQYVVVDDARRAVVTITAREEHRDGRLLELAAAALDALGG